MSADEPIVVVPGPEPASVAVYLPIASAGEGRLVVSFGGRRTAQGAERIGETPLDEALAAFRDRPGTLLVCELKAEDVIDEFDMTGFRASYAAAFAKSIAAIRPGFTNVVAFATDMGILETLRSLFPSCPTGFRSRYKGGAANEYRLGRLRGSPWVWLPFGETPVTTVRLVKDAGTKVLMAPISGPVAYDQARIMGADAVLASDRSLDWLNDRPPPRRADGIPSGALALGFTKCVVDERCIMPADIKTDYSDKSAAKWYSGLWFRRDKPPAACYTNRWGFLEMTSDCVIMSTPPRFGQKGLLPLLHGREGFYIEFTVSLSDFHPSHACSLWLYPTKKLPGGGDVPWFFEIDVDEARFGMGLSGSMHNMGEGNPMHLCNYNNVRIAEMERTKPITFGVSYDPRTEQCAWWHSLAGNGELEMVETAPFVPRIAKEEDFFYIITCRGPEGRFKDTQPKYKKFVYSVRAFVPESSQIPAAREASK